MFHAIKRGDLAEVHRLIEKDPNCLQSRPDSGYLPLHWACGIHNGSIAIKNPNLEILAYLIEHTDINIKDTYHNTPWVYLMSKRTDSSILDVFLQSTKAIDMGLTTCNVFLKSLSPLIKGNFRYITPFHCACINGVYDNVKYVLEHRDRFDNFDIDFSHDYLSSPLHNVVSRGYLDIMHLLIEAGARLDIIDERNDTLLHSAVHSNRINMVKYFVERHFDIYGENNQGDTALSLSIKNSEIIQYLLSQDPRIPNCMVLIEAVQIRSFEVSKLLLNRGVDINGCDDKGWTPLHYACDQLSEDFIILLLDYGADPTICDQRGRTCIDLILQSYRRDDNRDQKIIDIIRNYQAIPNIKEPE